MRGFVSFITACCLLLCTHAYIRAPVMDMEGVESSYDAESGIIPLVLMHGMGDAAAADGMQSIKRVLEKKWKGLYVSNIAIGNSIRADRRNSFFMNMNDQLKLFAAAVRADPKLRDGFNAMGLSQGNLLIRGYVQRYNDPPVLNFVSVHGPMMGVGALPHCPPGSSSRTCKVVNAIVKRAAYTYPVQHVLAQSNYYRHPFRVKKFCTSALFLPELNNEAVGKQHIMQTLATLKSLVLIRATEDAMVLPPDSAWFGAYADNDYSIVVPMNESKAYKTNSFGLRTLDEAGRIVFTETKGGHLQFNREELFEWILDDFNLAFVYRAHRF